MLQIGGTKNNHKHMRSRIKKKNVGKKQHFFLLQLKIRPPISNIFSSICPEKIDLMTSMKLKNYNKQVNETVTEKLVFIFQ